MQDHPPVDIHVDHLAKPPAFAPSLRAVLTRAPDWPFATLTDAQLRERALLEARIRNGRVLQVAR